MKIIEVDGKNRDGSPNKTYSYEPKAKGPSSTTAAGRSSRPRPSRTPARPARSASAGTGSRSPCPPEAEGKSVFFQTTVDDYGEVWVDGKLPRKPGDTGGPIVAGFNVPNRVELKDAEAGQELPDRRSSASTARSPPRPRNWIFLGPTFLELVDKK